MKKLPMEITWVKMTSGENEKEKVRIFMLETMTTPR